VIVSALVILHKWIQRYRNSALIQFSTIQSFIVLVSAIETTMMSNRVLESIDSMIVGMALIGCLSTISFNQENLLISYLAGGIYSLIRTYFAYGSSEIFKYLKFNFSLILSLILIVFFSRAVNQIQRVNFISSCKQKLLLSVFNEMILSFHDGLMISANE